jgi:LysR family transcriptional regulator, hypochlorite-specific transcription factor HypT
LIRLSNCGETVILAQVRIEFEAYREQLVEIKWLEDFVAVASTGNFSRAAETRNVTQPAFSRRLKALEMWIGVPLLDRSSYPITLTPAGVKFLPVAERAIRDLNAGRDDVREVSSASETILRFAMPHSLAVGFFPFWWQVTGGAEKKIKVKVIADNYHDCIEMLLNGACHILMCYRNDAVPDPLSASGCEGMAIDHDRLLLVSVPNSNGLPVHSVGTMHGPRVPFLNYAPDAFLGKVTASLLNSVGPRLKLELRYESAFAEAVRAQTLTGAGVSWLPRSLILDDLKDGRLVPAGQNLPEASLEIWMYKSAKDRSSIVESLWTDSKMRRTDAGAA